LTKKAGASSTTPSQQQQQQQEQNEQSTTTADASTQQPSQRVQGNDSKDNSNRKSTQRPETKTNPPKQNNKQKQKPKQTNANKKGDSTANEPDSSSPSFATTANTTTVSPHQCQQTNDLEYGKGQMITVLHIAEKPSIAQAIAKGLSVRNGEKGDTRSNKSSSLPVYEFVETKTPFPKAPHASSVCHKVTSVAGHVFSVDFPSNYQNWDAVDPAQLFDAPVRKTPTSPGIIKHLQNVAKNVDFIVLWLDCDREGENIAFECLGICMNLMKVRIARPPKSYLVIDGADQMDLTFCVYFPFSSRD
jgi:DNA topoisomerase-3